MEKDILELLENDSRISAEQIAEMLGKNVNEIKECIAKLEKENVICGYSTLINWDNTEREYVSALIEVKVTPQRDQGFDKIAQRIQNFDEVKAVYLMSGAFDLTVIMEGRNIKEISKFISTKLSTLDSVLSTATHFVLKKYKDHGVILEQEKTGDERMIVSPWQIKNLL